MQEKQNKIAFIDENNEKVELIVLEKTEFNGCVYVLACESDDDESLAYVLRQSGEDEDDLVYEIVDDDRELEALAPIFEELLEGEVELIPDDDNE